MRLIKRLIVLAALCGSQLVCAQTPYFLRTEFRNANSNWIFGRTDNTNGDSALHLDFRTDPPTVSHKQLWLPLTRSGTRSATLTVSDPADGTLLFYTEGLHVRNRKQEIMPNGTGLKGDDYLLNGYYRLSMHQGFCAVPVPGSSTRYYLFNLTHAGTNTTPAKGKLYYSIVDMTMDNGYGDVDPSYKNIPLDTAAQSAFGEAIIAIPGDNCDVWLLTYDRGVVGYKAFHITDQGIHPIPVISPSVSGLGVSDMMQGKFALSSNRKMISMAYNFNAAIIGYPRRGCIIAKFDVATGSVFDEMIIESVEGGSCSAFSPDDTKLYLGSRRPGNGRLILSQYDISVYNPVVIAQSRYIIDSTGSYGDAIRRWGNQLITAGIGDNVALIQQPNRNRQACEFRKYFFSAVGVTSPDTVVYSMGLGNDVILPLPPQTYYRVRDTFECRIDADTGIWLTADPGGVNYVWENGQAGPDRKVTGPGSYWVNYMKGCHTFFDTFYVRESAYARPEILVDGVRLYVRNDYAGYQWFRDGALIGGATSFEYYVTKNAGYHVAVLTQEGCHDQSSVYTVTNLGMGDHPSSPEIRVYPNPSSHLVHIEAPGTITWRLLAVDGRVVRSGADRKKTLNVQDLAKGLYMLEVRDGDDGRLLKREKLLKE
jgi:hypothetical protein